MKAHYQSEIDALNRRLRALADEVLGQVRCAARAATQGDASSASAVADCDRDVDRQEVQIEEECLKILALYAPVADELRYVFGVTKVNHELERIGDLATKIAGQAGMMATNGLPPVGGDIVRLGELAVAAVTKALDAFVGQNADEARAVWEGDAALDEIKDHLCARFDEALAREGVPVEALLAARSIVAALERIGDHATRIAKVVLYMRHGEIVRHRPLPADPARESPAS